MRCLAMAVACVSLLTGCGDYEPEPAPLPQSPSVNVDEAKPGEARPGDEKPVDKKPDDADVLKEPKDIKLKNGITFTAPAGWRQVRVTGNIPEAEFAIPHVEGDEHDGRLTLMSAIGGLETNIDRWKSEFKTRDEPKTEKLKIDGIEATIVEIRGEWKGTSFRPVDPPRPDHRLIAVYLPLGDGQAFYAKLTGPKETLTKKDEEFRKFLKSGKVEQEP